MLKIKKNNLIPLHYQSHYLLINLLHLLSAIFYQLIYLFFYHFYYTLSFNIKVCCDQWTEIKGHLLCSAIQGP